MSAAIHSIPPERGSSGASNVPVQDSLITTIIDCSVELIGNCTCFNRYAGYNSNGVFIRYLTAAEVAGAKFVQHDIVVRAGTPGLKSRPMVVHTLHAQRGTPCYRDEGSYVGAAKQR